MPLDPRFRGDDTVAASEPVPMLAPLDPRFHGDEMVRGATREAEAVSFPRKRESIYGGRQIDPQRSAVVPAKAGTQ